MGVTAGTDPAFGHPQILLRFRGVKMHECAQGYQNIALPQVMAISGAVLDLTGKTVYCRLLADNDGQIS